jgi:dihydrofolate reductase
MQMGIVIAHMSMSLDGFIADRHDQVGPLFDWYDGGPVETPSAGERWTFHTDPASAEILSTMMARAGALICGRRLFDLTGGWGGQHPVGCPVVVVTHSVPDGWPRAGVPFTFVTSGGVAQAVAEARAIAGEKNVVIASPSIMQQCLDLALLDEIHVSLIPVLLGAGIPFFANLGVAPVMLEDSVVTPGRRVTHPAYRVVKN